MSPLKVLFVKSRNHGSYAVEPLSDRQSKNFKNFFAADIAMYRFFNISLQRKIEKFGTNRMEIELEKIKLIFKKCQKNPTLCEFQKKPKKSLKNQDKAGIPITPLKYIELMDENWGFCDNPANPYKKILSISANRTFNVTCPWTDDSIAKHFLP